MQTRSEVKEMQHPLRSSLLYHMHSVEAQPHLVTRRQKSLFPPGIRDQKPYDLVFTISVSNRLDNLSTGAGDYMNRHTFVCCKLLGTYIFSGFQKKFLEAERQY